MLLTPQLVSDLPSVTPSPSEAGGGGDNPLDEHLGLIIGVPVGLGLCILFGIGCFIWLGE